VKSQAVPLGLSTPGRDRPQEVGEDFGARLGGEIAFAVDADADRSHVYECLIVDFGK
jgi:hypothetical protein